ncbi:unnamed protein product [Notodromas monacha]|uniref:Uncharacterized protein n=1 Tax=Notodromas monacha TaxID=399045 RepID=A0A7R9BJ83_9CRUS|nr:unnamed protein product [Notodromas monacha]CAG0915111.1 unnamed protein product [Notodromas monacha]
MTVLSTVMLGFMGLMILLHLSQTQAASEEDEGSNDNSNKKANWNCCLACQDAPQAIHPEPTIFPPECFTKCTYTVTKYTAAISKKCKCSPEKESDAAKMADDDQQQEDDPTAMDPLEISPGSSHSSSEHDSSLSDSDTMAPSSITADEAGNRERRNTSLLSSDPSPKEEVDLSVDLMHRMRRGSNKKTNNEDCPENPFKICKVRPKTADCEEEETKDLVPNKCVGACGRLGPGYLSAYGVNTKTEFRIIYRAKNLTYEVIFPSEIVDWENIDFDKYEKKRVTQIVRQRGGMDAIRKSTAFNGCNCDAAANGGGGSSSAAAAAGGGGAAESSMLMSDDPAAKQSPPNTNRERRHLSLLADVKLNPKNNAFPPLTVS